MSVRASDRSEAAAQNRDDWAFARHSPSPQVTEMAVHRLKVLGFCALLFAVMLGGTTSGGDVQAQNLPSWAESQPSRRVDTGRRTESYQRSRGADQGSYSEGRGGSYRASRGGFRTRAPGGSPGPPQQCSTSRDCSGYPNAYCGTNGQCFTNGSGPGNASGGGQQPSDVPIGEHGLWLIMLGLGYGVRQLWTPNGEILSV